MKKVFLSVIFIAALLACQEPLKPHTSNNFVHVSTETISDHETIDIYKDTLNDRLCYLYKNTWTSAATNFSCVK